MWAVPLFHVEALGNKQVLLSGESQTALSVDNSVSRLLDWLHDNRQGRDARV